MSTRPISCAQETHDLLVKVSAAINRDPSKIIPGHVGKVPMYRVLHHALELLAKEVDRADTAKE